MYNYLTKSRSKHTKFMEPTFTIKFETAFEMSGSSYFRSVFWRNSGPKMTPKTLILLNLDEAVLNLLMELPTSNIIKLDNLGDHLDVIVVKKFISGIHFANLCLKD